MTFLEHGSYSIEHHGDFIIVDATGPFNEQSVIKYKNELEIIIQRLNGRKWKQIIIMNDMSIFTPEAERELRETLKLRKNHGLIFSAVVCGSKLYNGLIRGQLSRCYLSLDIAHKFFNDLEEAKQWLKNNSF